MNNKQAKIYAQRLMALSRDVSGLKDVNLKQEHRVRRVNLLIKKLEAIAFDVLTEGKDEPNFIKE